MSEEERQEQQEQQEDNPASAYVKQIEELRKNSVTKTDYDKIVKERDELIKGLANQTYQPEESKKPEPSREDMDKRIVELRNKLLYADSSTSNLEYATNALELRKLWIEKTGKDPFVADNAKVTPTEESITSAENLASVMEQAIAYADGDSEVFTGELMRRTKDVVLPKNDKRRK